MRRHRGLIGIAINTFVVLGLRGESKSLNVAGGDSSHVAGDMGRSAA